MALAQLRLAPQAGRSNDASRRQRVEARAQVRHEAVARVLSRGDRSQTKELGQAHRHVLRGVHCNIGPPVLERGLELLDEKALSADLGERPIDDLVAPRRDSEDAHLAMRIQALELARDVLGLPHREPAPARRDDDSFGIPTQLSSLAYQRLDLSPLPAAHRQPFVEPLEDHGPSGFTLALGAALDAAYPPPRHQAIAVNPHEHPAEFLLELRQRLLDQVLAGAGPHGDVFELGSEVNHVRDTDQSYASALGNAEKTPRSRIDVLEHAAQIGRAHV